MATRSPLPPAPIIIHGWRHLEAALSAGRAAGVVPVVSPPPAAAGYAGAGWFAALVRRAAAERPESPVIAVLDCADHAGHVLAGLRAGLPRLRFTGPPRLAEKLADMAAVCGASLLADPAGPVLDLGGEADPEAACRRWLAGAAGVPSPTLTPTPPTRGD